MVTTSDFRTGLILIIEKELYAITDFQHVKMARGGAFVRTKLKNVRSGRVIEKTFRSGEKVEDARVERRPMQYLYREGDQLVFMETESYEQVTIGIEFVGIAIDFLREGETLDVLVHNDTPISVELPIFVNLAVVSTEPGIKGDTVSGGSKKALLETGGSIQVPLFIEEGNVLKVDTRTGEYIERVK
jgi:elongation factor P